MTDNVTPIHAERRLADIIRRVKIDAAERDGVVIDMKDADRARLELLIEDLRPVLADVPADADQFDFALSSGLEPRFFVDAVAHVHMGRDRRTYRFVRDTRLGRVVLVEDGDRAVVAGAVSRYVAERLIERQRMLEGDMETVRDFYARRDYAVSPRARGRAAAARDDDDRAMAAIDTPLDASQSSNAFVLSLLWFVLGCVAGSAGFALAFWERLSSGIN